MVAAIKGSQKELRSAHRRCREELTLCQNRHLFEVTIESKCENVEIIFKEPKSSLNFQDKRVIFSQFFSRNDEF